MTGRACWVAALLMSAASLPVWAADASLLRAQVSQAQCRVVTPVAGSRVFDSARQWQAAVGQPEAQVLGRAVAWSQERVALVALGQQPSLGINLAVDRAYEVGDAARLWVRVSRPGPGQVAAMALSQPCVWAVLSRSGWQWLLVADAQNPRRLLDWVGVTPVNAGR